jgi:peptidoglycan hydrolase-like protein with peptidoglycan-binding domain
MALTINTAAPKVDPQQPSSTQEGGYLSKPGDSLASIASGQGVELQALRDANPGLRHRDNTLLVPGTSLKVPPRPEVTTQPADAPPPADAAPPEKRSTDGSARAAVSQADGALRQRLEATVPASPGGKPAPSLRDVESRKTMLKPGDTGEPVTHVQKALGLPPEQQTGVYDDATKAAVGAFQDAHNLKPGARRGSVGGQTLEALRQQGPGTTSLDAVKNGTAALQDGDVGKPVADVQRLLGVKGTGVFDTSTRLAVEKLQLESKLPVTGEFNGATLQAAQTRDVVDTNNPTLRTLASARLQTGATGTCVATSMRNLDRLGIPSFAGGTSGDANNPRGAMVQLIQNGHWKSAPLPGSELRTIKSPYGTVQAHVLPAAEYDRLAREGKIPEGSLNFQTRHGWDYSKGSKGNDMGITQNGSVHNYANMGGMRVYGDLKEVVILVPADALRR